jgi:hypothetical protein
MRWKNLEIIPSARKKPTPQPPAPWNQSGHPRGASPVPPRDAGPGHRTAPALAPARHRPWPLRAAGPSFRFGRVLPQRPDPHPYGCSISGASGHEQAPLHRAGQASSLSSDFRSPLKMLKICIVLGVVSLLRSPHWPIRQIGLQHGCNQAMH